MKTTSLAIMLMAAACCAQPRFPVSEPRDDLGSWPNLTALNSTGTTEGKAVLYPESIAGGGAVIYSPLIRISDWTDPATDGTWTGYTSAGLTGAATANEPTIASSATLPRYGAATTLISWDPAGAVDDGQYVEFIPAAATATNSSGWTNLQWMWFLCFAIGNSSTTGATELDFALYDSAGNLLQNFDISAIATADVWIQEELDLRIVSLRGKLAKVYKLRITHNLSSSQDTTKLQELVAYQFSYGNGPVWGNVVRYVADASMARGSLVQRTVGDEQRVTAALSNSSSAIGFVVESASTLMTPNAEIVAPTAAGKAVYVYVQGPAFGRAAASVGAYAIGDPVSVVSSTTVDDDDAVGRSFGVWEEIAVAGGDYGFSLSGLSGSGGGSLPPADSLDRTEMKGTQTADENEVLNLGTFSSQTNLADNLASAYSILEGLNVYLSIITTNGSEILTLSPGPATGTLNLGGSAATVNLTSDAFTSNATDGADDAWAVVTGANRWIDIDLGATDILRLIQTAGLDAVIGNTTGDLQIETATWDISVAGAGTGFTTLSTATATATDDGVALTPTAGGAASFRGTFSAVDLTVNRLWKGPDVDGTIITTGDTGTITGTMIANDTVALTTDTSGNYAAGDAEAGNALTGDSATGFFGAGLLEVARGGTNLASGTDGGILGYTAAGVLASSVLLTANAIVLGGGAGATPTPMASLGTTTTVLHGNAAGAPTFGGVVTGDITDGTIVDADLDAAAAISRTKLATNSYTMTVNLNDLRVWDAPHLLLLDTAGTPSADDLGILYGTFGTRLPYLASVDLTNLPATTLRAGFRLSIPENYLTGGTVTIRVNCSMVTATAVTSATVDIEAYRQVTTSTAQNTVGSDLCTTAAQSCNTLTLTNFDFTIDPATVAAGDQLDVRLSAALDNNSDPSAKTWQANSIKIIYQGK